MQFTIRSIGKHDETEFMDMVRIFQTSPAVLHDAGEEVRKRVFRELMQPEHAYLQGFIVEADGVTAGYALLSKMYSTEVGGMCIWLEELYVKPEFRGYGAAKFFLNWMKMFLPAARYRLEITAQNTDARRLYEKDGFTELPYIQMAKDNALPG